MSSTAVDWDAIQDAVQSLVNGTAVNRIDGEGWKVYRAGAVIRVDINPKEKQ